MAGFSRTTYPSGTMRTEAGYAPDAGAQLSGLGGLNLDDILRLRRRQAQPERERPTLAGADPYERAMKDLAMRERVAEVQANTMPAPTKTSFTANALGGWTQPDALAMNRFQREAFLPDIAYMGR